MLKILTEKWHNSQALARTYELLMGEDEARYCRDIPDSACRALPGNFFVTLLANFLTKLGDALVDAKTVLPWLLGTVGAPALFIGLLVPIRESGSLLPQVLIAAFIRRLAVRKWVWVAGSLLQGMAVAAMIPIALYLQGAEAGVALVAALVVFSLARGLSSIASKDVLGKTIPKQRRGRVTGYSASLAGCATLLVGVALLLPSRFEGTQLFLWLLGLAAVLWFLAGLCFVLVREQGGATEGGGSLLRDGLGKFDLLRTDQAFRDLCIARGLLLASALSAPYYVALARERDQDLAVLGGLVLVSGAAGLVSGPFWGRLADHSSRALLRLCALLTAASGVAVFLLDRLWDTAPAWVFVAAFFTLAVVHQGVRLGRKTYVVDMASGNRRTDYVATGNTLIGLLLLLCSGLSVLTLVLDESMMVLILAVPALLAAGVASRLPDVQ